MPLCVVSPEFAQGMEPEWTRRCSLSFARARVVDYGGGPGLLGYVLLKGEYGLSSYTNVDIANSSLTRTLKNLKNWSSLVHVVRAIAPTDVHFGSLRPTIFFCVGGVIVHMSDAYLEQWARNVDASGAASVVMEWRKSEVSEARAAKLLELLASYSVVCERSFERDFINDHKYPPEQQRHMIYLQRKAPAARPELSTAPQPGAWLPPEGQLRGPSVALSRLAAGGVNDASAAPAVPASPRPSCPDGTSTFHAEALGVCRCECVLVDVGLNNGYSLMEWPRQAAMELARADRENEHRSEVNRRMHQCLRKRETTCYYGFEGNPAFDERLMATQEQLRRRGHHVKLYTSTVFSTHGGEADFFVEPARFHTGAVLSTLDPSLKLVSKVQPRKGARILLNTSETVRRHYQRTRVKSTDAAAFLSALAEASDFVAMKLDIESFEYTLLPHLILTNPQRLCATLN